MSSADAAARLYEALNAHDPQRVLAALDESFMGKVSAGMPLEVGGVHHGAEAMLRDVWARVFTHYDVRLDVEEIHTVAEGTLIAIGDYRGNERESGRSFAARFAHVLEVDEGRITFLEQITDSRSWVYG